MWCCKKIEQHFLRCLWRSITFFHFNSDLQWRSRLASWAMDALGMEQLLDPASVTRAGILFKHVRRSGGALEGRHSLMRALVFEKAKTQGRAVKVFKSHLATAQHAQARMQRAGSRVWMSFALCRWIRAAASIKMLRARVISNLKRRRAATALLIIASWRSYASRWRKILYAFSVVVCAESSLASDV